MPKPTLWQSILGKPSQAYSFPQENTYFSSKQDMLRIAAEVEQQRLRQQIQSIEALQQVTILFAFSLLPSSHVKFFTLRQPQLCRHGLAYATPCLQ